MCSPSIASGNQVCNPNWADLPIAPINISKAIVFNKFSSKFKKLIVANLKNGVSKDQS